MYQPRHFVETRPELLLELIHRHPLATLVLPHAQGLEATPLPLQVFVESDGSWRLQGHLARANPLASLQAVGEVLAVFTGPQGYVSPGWYPSKTEHGKVVPTWNYATVHVWGHLRLVDDRVWLRAQIARLTATHEAGRPQPWAPEDAPADYLERMLDAVVGLEITVTRTEGKFKLSQNRPASDVQGVIDGAARAGEADLSRAVARARDEAPGP